MRVGHKLFRAPVWVSCKLSSNVVQTEFGNRTTSCIVYDVVISQRYSLVCTYSLNERRFLLRSRASDGVSRRIHLNLHESVHVLCEKISFASGLIVHHRLIIVPRFADFYDDVPDGYCFLQLDRDPHTRDTTFAPRMTTDTIVGCDRAREECVDPSVVESYT